MENVSDETVRSLKEMGWDLPYNIYVNGVPLDDYDAEANGRKNSFLKSMFIKSAMAADKGNNVIKFVFENKLDQTVKPSKIDKEECLNTEGKWDGERCFCPTGSYMTADGCVTKCGGDTGIACPDESICYRDEECRGCLEICSNGKCVIDKNNKANGVPYCEGTKIITTIVSGSKDTACATNTTAKDCAMYAVDMTCAEENGEAKCVQEKKCEDGTELCPEWGDCLCVPDGYSSACNYENCIACSPTEGTALCPDNRGNCTCI